MIEVEIIDTGMVLLSEKGERIRMTYQASDFADAGSAKGSFSTSIKIPWTAHNLEALGFSNVVNVKSTLSRSKNIKARLIDNNNEIDNGFIRIDDDNFINKTITITFLGRNVDWFSALGDSNIADLDLSRYDHIANASIINSDRSEGYIYLPIDYGSLEAKSSAVINFDEIFPAMFVRDIIKQMFKELGYKLGGTLMKRPELARMLIPFRGENEYHTQKWVNDRTMTVGGYGTQVIPNVSSQVLRLDNLDEPLYRNSLLMNFNDSSYRYYADEPMYIILAIHIAMQSQSNFTVHVRKNGLVQQSNTFNQRNSYYTNVILLDSGDYVDILIQPMGTTEVVLFEGFYRTYVDFIVQKEIAPNSIRQIAGYLPDMKQKELIEYIFFRFGVIPSFDKSNGTIILNTLDDLNVEGAENWSGKIDFSQSIERDFFDLVSDYCKENICKYDDDSSDTLLSAYKEKFGVEYGQGSINIDNDYLEGSQEYFSSKFTPTKSRNVFTGIADLFLPLPYMPRNGNAAPRILYYEPNMSIFDLTGGQISTMTIAGQVVSHIPYAYFINVNNNAVDPIITDHLGFGDPLDASVTSKSILESTYRRLSQVLNNPLVAKPSLSLGALQISTLDYTKLKYIEDLGGYYYLNQVGQYDGSGDPTECELIKWY